MKSNWAMLLVDERRLQPDLVGADRIVPVASVAASRDLDASASTQRAATSIAAATNLQQHRPSGICRVVSVGTRRAGRFEDRQAGDRDPVASCRLPSVLALEIKTAQWPSKRPAGSRSAHSQDQSRQPIMGAPRIHGELLKPLQSIWRGEGDRSPKGGRRSFIIMPTASRRWTCSWFRRSHSDCSTG
jgi:hypothetical protein